MMNLVSSPLSGDAEPMSMRSGTKHHPAALTETTAPVMQCDSARIRWLRSARTICRPNAMIVAAISSIAKHAAQRTS